MIIVWIAAGILATNAVFFGLLAIIHVVETCIKKKESIRRWHGIGGR